MKNSATIDGWDITLFERHDPSLPWRADASDHMWGKFEYSEGFSAEDALSSLALKTGIDRQELLTTFGL